MTRDDMIRMAREAGWSGLYMTYNEPTGQADWKMVKESLTVPVTMAQIERFAALVAAAEREACAKVCEDIDDTCPECIGHNDHDQCVVPQKWEYADAIRARGQS